MAADYRRGRRAAPDRRRGLTGRDRRLVERGDGGEPGRERRRMRRTGSVACQRRLSWLAAACSCQSSSSASAQSSTRSAASVADVAGDRSRAARA